MNISSKLTKKSIVITLVLIIILGLAITFFLVKKNDSVHPDNQSSSEENSNAPGALNEPKPEGLESPADITLDSELPEGTISPHTVASDAGKYFGKELKIRGLIVEASSGNYSITSQKAEENLGLRLDFSKSDVNPQQYSNSGFESNERKFSDPVTVVGKLKAPDGKNPLTLEVKSIQQ